MNECSAPTVAEAMDRAIPSILSVSLVETIRKALRIPSPVAVALIVLTPLIVDSVLRIWGFGSDWPMIAWVGLLCAYPAYVIGVLRRWRDRWRTLGQNIDELLHDAESQAKMAGLVEKWASPGIQALQCLVVGALGTGCVALATTHTTGAEFSAAWYVAVFIALTLAEDTLTWMQRFDRLLIWLSREPRFYLTTYLPLRTRSLRDIRSFGSDLVLLAGVGILIFELPLAWAAWNLRHGGYSPLLLVMLGVLVVGLLFIAAGIVVLQRSLNRIVTTEQDRLLDDIDPVVFGQGLDHVLDPEFETKLARCNSIAATRTTAFGASTMAKYAGAFIAPLLPSLYALVKKALGE